VDLLAVVVASLAPTIAALAAWRRPRGAAQLERIEQSLADLLEWQVRHARQHKLERFGGMQ
jgi:hypothetical protein